MSAQITTTLETPLQRVVSNYEERICGKWKPNRDFYNHVRINQKRFGMLLRGEAQMTMAEGKVIARFFNIPITDLF